jgi:hypothetical protein
VLRGTVTKAVAERDLQELQRCWGSIAGVAQPLKPGTGPENGTEKDNPKGLVSCLSSWLNARLVGPGPTRIRPAAAGRVADKENG